MNEQAGTQSAENQGTTPPVNRVDPAVSAPPAGDAAKTPEKPSPALFTQEQLDAIMQKRVQREQEKAQKAQELAVAAAKKEAEEAVRAAQGALTQEQAKAQAAAFAAQVTVEAVRHGVGPDQVEAFTRLVSADSVVNEDGNVDAAKVAAAVKQVVETFPGLLGSGVKSVGGRVNSQPDAPALTLAQAVQKRLGG